MIAFKKIALGVVLTLGAFGCSDADAGGADVQPQLAAQVAASRTIDIPVTLRGSGRATLKANVFPNAAATGASTILSVPGFNATSKVYKDLTAALFADALVGPGVKQVITIDLPGHGDSTRPTGVKFGDLTLEDYADAVVQTIKALASQSLAPTLVFGYGAGGLTVATAQEQLLKSGSSLAQLGVRAALLYAPVPSGGRPWTMQPTDIPTVTSYLTTNDADGTFYVVPPAAWNRAAFTNKAGTVLPNAPTADQVTANGFAAPEPVSVLSQLTQFPDPALGTTRARPEVRAGAFAPANGTQLTVLSFSEAIQVTSADVADFYIHLTGDAAKARLVELVAADAVGNVFLLNPKSVVDATHGLYAQ